MSLLTDAKIIQRSVEDMMISPFFSTLIRTEENRKIVSFGLSSAGYDARLHETVKLFTNVNSAIVDPKKVDEKCFINATIESDEDGGKYFIIPPNSYALGHTTEYFRIPRDILAICLGKSTYARTGIIVNVTPLEPEWYGHVVIEISNATPLPVKVYVNEGICQFIFHQTDGICNVSYDDRGGKYQGQGLEITHHKV